MCRQDDEQAFRVFYNRHWPNLYLTACRKLRRTDIAEELTQDLFVKLWEKRHDAQLLNPAAYLNTAIRHLIISYIRQHLHEANYLDHLRQYVPLEATATMDQVQFGQLNEAMQEALAELPEKTRTVFVMSRFEQLSVREMAQRLNLSEKAVEYHLTRSLTFLRGRLKDFALAGLWLWLN